MAEDNKFRFNCETGQFVNRVSGEAIPNDEPVMIFRARDVHALATLIYYQTLVADAHHRRAVQDKVDEFRAYMIVTPWAMKEPGVTHHVKLKPTEGEVFAYLEELRRSGETNMWGAPDYLRRQFLISSEAANALFFKWMHRKEEEA